ncbi:2054_t:CDS:1 [Paraglomus occultum]|uniref:2054_t:CDS:1 n=1 Tax=Paraglomus occultum TaxID=144539 RepID=A0A9N8Z495_9GLOM|nr:2054_t:CDS:1 [Paraglomus occultum]
MGIVLGVKRLINVILVVTKRPSRQNPTVDAIETILRETEKARDEAIKTQKAQAAKIKKLEKENALIRSVSLEAKPTKQQYEEAKSMLKDPNGLFYHFAVAGHAGTGKSSLINALRGCKDKDKGAAKVGVAETTMEIGRYPDNNSAFDKFVWYDIPGAGTQLNSQWQYFHDKRLFVFDFVIICWKDRIMETDMQILKSCKTWNIPTFFVRTSSKTHIFNLMQSEEITNKDATAELRNTTRKTVEENFRQGNYNGPAKVYITDRYVLQQIVSNFTKKFHLVKDYNFTADDMREIVNVQGIIDEPSFLMDLVVTARERRCKKLNLSQ